MLPTQASGITELFFVVNVFEVGNQVSVGATTVILPKDDRFPINYDPTVTQVGIPFVENGKWTYHSSNSSFHIWTSTNSISNNGTSSFGFTGFFDPQNIIGTVSYSATIVSTSGGEENGLNNIDVETLIYFSNYRISGY